MLFNERVFLSVIPVHSQADASNFLKISEKNTPKVKRFTLQDLEEFICRNGI